MPLTASHSVCAHAAHVQQRENASDWLKGRSPTLLPRGEETEEASDWLKGRAGDLMLEKQGD